MTHEDKITEAIDRLTKHVSAIEAFVEITGILVSASLLGILITLVAIAGKASPILITTEPTYEIGVPPMPPLNPNLQRWHTAYVPTDNGVYPLEVFAPVLPRVEFQRTSEPMVNTPEPGTLTVAGLSILGMMFLNLLLLNRSSKIVELTKREKMIRHIHIEPATRICAYPPCRKPFTPKKSNQICCNPKHTYNMQQARIRQRRKERNAQSKP